MWVDSSNPANTAANTVEVEKALRALELCVVVDVAMTETARLAHYVLPASSQYEKTEFTLFNFEFPTNYLPRPRRRPAAAGGHPAGARDLHPAGARARAFLPGDNALAPLREAASRSRREFAAAFRAFMAENPRRTRVAPLVLYNTLGADALPDGTAAAAPLWNAALACAKRSPQAVRRALGATEDVPEDQLGDALFDAIVRRAQGTVDHPARL